MLCRIFKNLSQVTFANIVAVVNSESKLTYTAMGIHSFETMGDSLSGDTVSKGESNGALFHSGTDIEHRGTRNRHLQKENYFSSNTPPAPPNTAASPNTAKSLMSERSKYAITPRSFKHSPNGFFNENNCLNVNVELANMVNVRTSQTIAIDYKPVNVRSSETISEERLTLLTRTQRTPALKINNDQRFKPNGEHITSYALCGTGLNNSVKKDHLTATRVRTIINVSQNFTESNERNQSSYISSRSRGEDHQPQVATKIHTSPTEIEQFKNQTEVSQCDAIYICDPITSYILYGASPILLVAQNKDSQRRCGFEIPVTKETARGIPAFDYRRAEYPFSSYVNLGTTKPLVLNRETKQINNFDPTEGLRIVRLNTECATISEAHTTNTNGQLKLRNKSFNNLQNNTRTWTQENIISNITMGENEQNFCLPGYLDVRQLTPSPSQLDRNLLPVKKSIKSILGSRRYRSLNLRDKFRSPSSGLSDNTSEKLTTSNEEFSLIGQSLPSVCSNKTITNSCKRGLKTQFSEPSLGPRESYRGIDESSQTSRQETSYQNEVISSTPLTLPGVNHKHTCEDKVITRTLPPRNKCSSVLTSERTGQEGEKNMKSETYNSNNIRKINCSLAHDSNKSVLRFEALTMRPLIGQALEPNYLDSSSFSPCKPVVSVDNIPKEPLYMGCSSQVAERDSRSQYHYINNCGDMGNIVGNLKVVKALDQDVYCDYQHEKYRDSKIITTHNTATDQPKMHFLKIKVIGDGISL
ncbi:unnamed protein product [Lymnaea stagnalis]|uniref:Uncharacterized protein n=1 Tax=Lymnaea stagnalis TaxID=6523 RepID=A0AAV2HPL2_LYMST